MSRKIAPFNVYHFVLGHLGLLKDVMFYAKFQWLEAYPNVKNVVVGIVLWSLTSCHVRKILLA